MKRAILYMVTLFTLALPLKGLSVYQHFCGGNLISFELFVKTSKACCKAPDQTCGGCEDHETVLTIDDYQVPQVSITIPGISFLYHVIHIAPVDSRISEQPYARNLAYRNPPGISGKHLAILNRSILL